VQRAIIFSSVAIAAYVFAVVIVNRSFEPRSGPLGISRAAGLERARDTISLLTWNLGYAGLGAGSDFITDGGTHYLPPSRAAVQQNLRGILAQLARTDVDVLLFQEVARAGPLNYWADVLAGLGAQLSRYASVFDAEIATKLIPPPLRIAHGTAIFSRLELASSERILLPREAERMAGLVRREYRMHIARLPIGDTGREWVIVNVHLAAFDSEAMVRRQQLREVMRFAEKEFQRGNPVLVGGDWNMEFVKHRFPHATDDKYLFWLHDFPYDELPTGWKAAFDSRVPSARTVYAPYEPGRTYVTVIDAFIVSPNVEVETVEGINMDFAYSDHQPVRGLFRYRPAR
jgi:endonuclease/exonuclease/phosphatase family metal-dependent hydrolase